MKDSKHFLVVCCIAAFVMAVATLAWSEGAPPAAPSGCQVTHENFGKAFLEKYCFSCHHSSKKGEIDREGAPKKLNYDDLEIVKSTKSKLVEYVSVNKKMPQNPPKPTDDERAKFKQWLECEYK